MSSIYSGMRILYKDGRTDEYVPGSPLPEAANGLPGTLCQTMVSCNYDMETLGLRWVILREDAIVFRVNIAKKWRIKCEFLIENYVGYIKSFSLQFIKNGQ